MNSLNPARASMTRRTSTRRRAPTLVRGLRVVACLAVCRQARHLGIAHITRDDGP